MVLEEAEFKILEALYGDDFQYIARNEDGQLYAFCEKPTKVEEEWESELYDRFLNLNYINVLFPNIKWEDDEPTSIERLLK